MFYAKIENIIKVNLFEKGYKISSITAALTPLIIRTIFSVNIVA